MLLNHREAEKWQPIQFVWSPWSHSEMNTVCILCVSNEQRAISILSIQFMSHYSSHIIRKSIVICVTILVFLSIFPSLFVAQNKNLVTLWLVIRTSFAAFLSPPPKCNEFRLTYTIKWQQHGKSNLDEDDDDNDDSDELNASMCARTWKKNQRDNHSNIS